MAIWIPRPVYEALPYVYVAAGTAMLLAAYFLPSGPRGWLVAAGLAAVVSGLVLWMHRRDYRSTQSEYDGRPLDE
jgi:branched-subunit amino acid transport protein